MGNGRYVYHLLIQYLHIGWICNFSVIHSGGQLSHLFIHTKWFKCQLSRGPVMYSAPKVKEKEKQKLVIYFFTQRKGELSAIIHWQNCRLFWAQFFSQTFAVLFLWFICFHSNEFIPRFGLPFKFCFCHAAIKYMWDCYLLSIITLLITGLSMIASYQSVFRASL